MLTVRLESVEAMQRDRLAQANRQLVAYAEQRFPTVFKPQQSERTRKLVEKIRAQAAEHGITREDNVASMIDLVTMFGLDFAKAPWAADVLSNSNLAGPDKISILRRRLNKQAVKI